MRKPKVCVSGNIALNCNQLPSLISWIMIDAQNHNILKFQPGSSYEWVSILSLHPPHPTLLPSILSLHPPHPPPPLICLLTKGSSGGKEEIITLHLFMVRSISQGCNSDYWAILQYIWYKLSWHPHKSPPQVICSHEWPRQNSSFKYQYQADKWWE